MKGLKDVALYNITMKTTPQQIGYLPDELGIVIQDFLRPTTTQLEKAKRQKIMSNLCKLQHFGSNNSHIIKKIQNYLIKELSDPDIYVNEMSIERRFPFPNLPNSHIYNIYREIFSYDDEPPSDIESKMFCLRDINAIMIFCRSYDLDTDDCDDFQGLIYNVVWYMTLEFSQFIFKDL